MNRGGTRSSKTYSLAQLFVGKFFREPAKRFLVARKTFPALRGSAMRDLIDIMKSAGVYHLCEHNRSAHTLYYPPLGNEMVFSSIDDSRKFRGPGWNYAWFNEANEFLFEDFQQVNLRLSNPSLDAMPNQIYLDFNPDDPDIWIKSELEDRARCETIQSTYRDNSFLDPETIAEIEYLRQTDANFWNIYGLGEYGQRTKGIIYTGWIAVAPEEAPALDMIEPVYGLDFGYNNATALVAVQYMPNSDGPGGVLYVREMIYQSNLTNSQLIELMKELIPNQRAIIYADCAEPQRIEEIYRAGYACIYPCDKSVKVKTGIDFVKRFPLRILATSSNTLAEVRQYKWREDKHGNPLDEPLKFRDHAMDALRYAVFTHGSIHWLSESAALHLPKLAPGGARARRTSKLLKGFD